MGGALSLQCDYWYETVFTIVAFITYFIGIAQFGHTFGWIWGAWDQYDRKYLPSLALHPMIFWMGWLIIYGITGALSWLTYNNGGMFCDQYVYLSLALFTAFVYAAWPITLFVFRSFLITWIIMAILAVWTVLIFVLNLIFYGGDIVIISIGHAILLVWFIYNTIWLILAWRCKGFGLPNVRGVIGFGLSKTKGLFDCPPGPAPAAGPGSFTSPFVIGQHINDERKLNNFA